MLRTPAPDTAEPRAHAPRDAPHRILLVEDDAGDTILFEDAVGEADPSLEIVSLTDVAPLEAELATAPASCIVLDLGLPGMTGFEALDRVEAIAPSTAVVVLTGWGDAQAGVDAMARGAQDYLVKGEVDGATIARSIRFAIERKRTQEAAAALAESELRQVEQHRLERALLVDPAIRRTDLAWTSRYLASRSGMVSGDFFDGIELPDGTVRMVIGDVSGHGADEAALGVSLRAGWRALVRAQVDPDDVLGALEDFLEEERASGDEFATVCDLTFAPDLSWVCVRSAGHPDPVLAGVGPLVDQHGRPPLGIRLGERSEVGTRFPLVGRWSLVAYTDGLFEVRDRQLGILGDDAVAPAVEAATVEGRIDADQLIASFAARTDEGWRDDVAVLVVEGAGPP